LPAREQPFGQAVEWGRFVTLAFTTITNASTPVPSTSPDGRWLFKTHRSRCMPSGDYVLGALSSARYRTSYARRHYAYCPVDNPGRHVRGPRSGQGERPSRTHHSRWSTAISGPNLAGTPIPERQPSLCSASPSACSATAPFDQGVESTGSSLRKSGYSMYARREISEYKAPNARPKSWLPP